MKTNKSYTKRLKFTKNGKIIARKPGQNHFNAKAARKKQLDKKRGQQLSLKPKILSRFVPHSTFTVF